MGKTFCILTCFSFKLKKKIIWFCISRKFPIFDLCLTRNVSNRNSLSNTASNRKKMRLCWAKKEISRSKTMAMKYSRSESRKDFFPRKNHRWKTNSSLLIFRSFFFLLCHSIDKVYLQECPIKSEAQTFPLEEFIGSDFFTSHNGLLKVGFLGLRGFREFLLGCDLLKNKEEKPENNKFPPSQNFCRPLTSPCLNMFRAPKLETTNLSTEFMVIF